MGRSSHSGVALLAAALAALAAPATATEYGLGNYQMGLVLPLAGVTPPPGVYFWDTFYLYQGSGALYQTSTLHSDTRVAYRFAANIAILAWFTDATIFGGELGFANTSAFGSDTTTRATPYADAFGINRLSTLQQEVAAFADTEFSAVLGWHAGEQHWSLTLSGFAPSGDYDPARIAQTGLNRPSLDLKGAYTYLGQSGLEATAALGLNANAVNARTNYQSGAELHLEWTLAQHLPFGLCAGVGGYFYQQVTADSGTGDPFGSFRGRVAAVGPIVTYTLKVGAQQVDFDARWFHEFESHNRVRGDTIFATMSFPLLSRPPPALASR